MCGFADERWMKRTGNQSLELRCDLPGEGPHAEMGFHKGTIQALISAKQAEVDGPE